MKTPKLNPKQMSLDPEYVNRLLGMEFKNEQIKSLLEMMRYKVTLDNEKINVYVPAYRTDILHPIDLVEDVAIAYGYENFSPEAPKIATIGGMDNMERFSNVLRNLLIGFNFQEIMTLIMTNETDLFSRMNIPNEDVLETENPVSLNHSVARNWLLPSLMSVLEKNKNREYPQRIFEIGDCINSGGNNKKKLSAVMAHSRANFSEIKTVITGLMEDLNLKCCVNKYNHNSFILGRCASFGINGTDSKCTDIGFFGEVHPQVLENFGLEVPVTAFEFDISKVFAEIY